jgi:AcrR family transcriptional regulator
VSILSTGCRLSYGVSVSTPDPVASGRRRGPARVSGDERERAVLAAFEALLAERSFGSITIDEITNRVGISRPTFYFYFASKEAILVQLLERMCDEVDAGLAALPRVPEDRRSWWLRALGVFVDVFGEHRAATLAISEARSGSSGVRDLWAVRYGSWVGQTASIVAAEQRRGAARAGIDAGATSVVLNAMNERVITSSLAGEEHALPAAVVLETLAGVWLTAIYDD